LRRVFGQASVFQGGVGEDVEHCLGCNHVR
jgi:hypothetical protein